MSRQVLYVAAPLRPNDADVDAIPPFTISPGSGEYEMDAKIWKPHETRVREALRANLDRAMRLLSWLRRSFPETTFVAPWIAIVLSGDDDSDPAVRERAMQDNFAVIERCDGIVLVGGRISDGMRREMEHGEKCAARCSHLYGFEVYSLADLVEPPLGSPPEYAFGGRASFRDYARAHEES